MPTSRGRPDGPWEQRYQGYSVWAVLSGLAADLPRVKRCLIQGLALKRPVQRTPTSRGKPRRVWEPKKQAARVGRMGYVSAHTR